MKIAIIGAGISGMTAAYLLSKDHDVVVYETNDYIGGHTHTIDVELNKSTYPVDTGFIVFNKRNYPNFAKLMTQLDIAWKPSDMSFSVTCEKTGLEFSPQSFNALFAQRRNLVRSSFYRMIADTFRFRHHLKELLKSQDNTITLGEYLELNNYSESFKKYFIIPMGESIWSADPNHFNEFPARYFAQFFKNHGFLNIINQPQWLVIKGGSKSYIPPLTHPYRERIYLNCPVKSVRRLINLVEVIPEEGKSEKFDHLIIATHSDQALNLLKDPSKEEQEILGTIAYQENEAVLHTDTSVLPKHKQVWAGWNHRILQQKQNRVAITYDMNILQGIDAPVEFCVTLNMTESIDPSKIIKKMIYHHPVYTVISLKARKRYHEINGVNRTYFCGAYWGYGFHEDGVNSALNVCKNFGKSL